MQTSRQQFSLGSLFFPITTPKAVSWIIVIGMVVFANLLLNGFVIDDHGQVLNNPSIQSISNIPNIFLNNIQAQEKSNYYRPLPYAVYAGLYAIVGEHSFFYHLVQLAFHIWVSILVFLVLKSWIKPGLASFLALLFLVHPINQETVAYIANLQDVQYVFFGLLALYLLQLDSKKLRYVAAANTCLLLSLFAKETGALFVVICLLYVAIFQKHKLLYQGIFSTIVAAIYVGIRWSADIPLQKAALLPMLQASLWERLISIPANIFYYLSTFLFPYKLSVIHTWVIHSIEINSFVLPLILDVLFFGAIIAVNYWLYRRGLAKAAVFFSMWLLLGLLFHLQLFPIDMTVADHYFYFTVVGLLGLVGVLLNSLKFSRQTARIGLAAGVIVLLVLSMRTMFRNTNWKDQRTLVTHDVQVEKGDYLLELLYSTQLIQDGQYSTALPYAQHAAAVFPQGWLAWNNIGAIYMMKEQPREAKAAYKRSIELGDYYGAYENMALLMLRQDSLENARAFIKSGLEKYPNSQKLWYFRTLASYKLEDGDDALMAAQHYDQLKQDVQSQQLLEAVRQKSAIDISF